MLYMLHLHHKNTKIFATHMRKNTFLNYNCIIHRILAVSQKPLQLKILLFCALGLPNGQNLEVFVLIINLI